MILGVATVLNRICCGVLQMAEQLGCKDQMAVISDWLLNAAKAVSEHNEESLGESSAVLRSSVDSSEGPCAKRQCQRLTVAQYWHYTRVRACKLCLFYRKTTILCTTGAELLGSDHHSVAYRQRNSEILGLNFSI